MSAVKAIDKQINSYLGQLNENQKKAVLTVVKTFADEQSAYDYWEDESFTAFVGVAPSQVCSRDTNKSPRGTTSE